jgi:sialic acid synthase SpsE
MRAGETITAADLVALRPATPGCITPDNINTVVGSSLARDVVFHDVVTPDVVS